MEENVGRLILSEGCVRKLCFCAPAALLALVGPKNPISAPVDISTPGIGGGISGLRIIQYGAFGSIPPSDPPSAADDVATFLN